MYAPAFSPHLRVTCFDCDAYKVAWGQALRPRLPHQLRLRHRPPHPVSRGRTVSRQPAGAGTDGIREAEAALVRGIVSALLLEVVAVLLLVGAWVTLVGVGR
jgi:hypothetical protein